jgi:hypothetical protein
MALSRSIKRAHYGKGEHGGSENEAPVRGLYFVR